MSLKIYLANLNDADALIRLNAVRVLGLMEETQALLPIRQLYTQEPDPEMKKAIAWAGERIYVAHKAGYSTLNEIFRVFKIDQEIENAEDAIESKLISQMDYNLSRDLNAIKAKGTLENAGVSGAGAAAMMAMSMGGIGGAMSMIQPGAGVASSNLGNNRPEIGKKRIPAAAPMTVNYDVWLRRLRDEGSPETRNKAAIELLNLNNPTVLPALVEIYLKEPAENIKAAILKTAKHLYLGATYWDWSQDGTIDAEYAKRLAVAGKDRAVRPAPVEEKRATAETPAEDLAKILQRAQEAREKRQKRR